MAAFRKAPLVLFLSADTGGGHRSAANAIRAAMNMLAPETASTTSNDTPRPTNEAGEIYPLWRGDVRDIIQECGRQVLRRTANLYGPTVEYSPRMYARIWYATNTSMTNAALGVVTRALINRGLFSFIDQLKPDVIVSVHGLLTRPALAVLRQRHVHIPFIEVVTDLVQIHRTWAVRDVDVCVAPTKIAYDALIGMGMPESKVVEIGMPIHPKFTQGQHDRARTLQNLGLAPNKFTALMVGGAEGVGGINEAARALFASSLNTQTIIVTGRNQELKAELEAALAPRNTKHKVLGFVDNMPELMNAADLVITKAGSLTISEALACGRPMLITEAIPGQEDGNIEYLASHGVGMAALTPGMVVQGVRRYAAMSPKQRAVIAEKARSLGRPNAAFDIARLILAAVPVEGQLSPWAFARHVRATRRRNLVFARQRINSLRRRYFTRI